MKNPSLFIEPLEARIAPAVLVNGGNLLGGDGNPLTGETSTGGNTVTLIKVLHGQALVFFDSSLGQITGISVGKGTKLDITGNIFGDIVTNLQANGRLTDSDGDPSNGEDGGVLLGYNIKGITTHKLGLENGDIGRIIAGGSVKNVSINGQINGIYAGDGIFRDGDQAVVSTGAVDYNSIKTGPQTTFVLTQALAKPTSSSFVSKVAVTTADQLEIFAGNGFQDGSGAGKAGGSISNVTITKTLTGEGSKPALFLHAGDGGEGTTGGEGGAISNFDDMGSIAYVKVQTGDGGTGDNSAGGAGGSLSASTVTTSSPRYDLFMGHGGSGGTTGGAGGSISTLNFTNNVTGGKSFITTGDFDNDGTQDVLLVNTLTGEATLSLGKTSADGKQPYTVALQSTTNADDSPGYTPFITAEGAVPTSVAVADLNGDGNLDFVVSYASTNNLGVFLGHGNGTFTASAVALSVSPTKIAVADFAGTAAPDIAVLSAGDLTTVTGGTNSQIVLVQNDGAANFTSLANPLTITGVGTDLVTTQIDKTGGNDLFVGLASGSIDSLLANGTGFTAGATIAAFNGGGVPSAPVTNLDVGPSGTNATELLAFTANVNVNNTGLTTVVPQVDVFSVGTTGAATAFSFFQPADTNAVAAHFVKNTDSIGVVASDALVVYLNGSTGYTAVSTVASEGVLNDFSATAGNGVYQIFAIGAATNRFFYTAGDPSSSSGLPVFKPQNTPFEPRIISFVGGDGGHGGSDHGGLGGGVTSLTYTQTLGGGVLQAGGTYENFVTTGAGGDSDGAGGGKGGDMSKITLSLAAGYQNEFQDDTSSNFLSTGHGGAGTTGGAGGSITKVKSTSVFVQTDGTNPTLGAVTMQITSGDGGAGTSGAGGAGGAITLDGPSSLNGVTFYDESATNPEAQALQVKAGNGGDGVTVGGAGGTLTNVGAQNALFGSANLSYNELSSALIQAGDGGRASAGNGGVGGGVIGLNVGVQGIPGTLTLPSGVYPVTADGSITVKSGSGGDATGGSGGNAGSVNQSTVASIAGDSVLGYGVLVEGGIGGTGDQGGGKGGSVKSLTLNTASTNEAFAGVIVGGDGGAATVSGPGGKGGTIKGITESKDVNSTINTLQAGNGGESASGAGGAGGSVKNITSAGFIGLPSVTPSSLSPYAGQDGQYLGVFDNVIPSSTIAALFATGGSVPQGIFAGRGADGANNGSVLDVVARQIAAISASVDASGIFAPAKLINEISADLIGYDAGRDGGFTSTQAGGVSPAVARPVDGFLLAGTIGTINVPSSQADRTAAFEFVG